MQFSSTQNAIRLVNLEDKLKKMEKELKEIRGENNKLRRDTRDMYNILYTVICNSHNWFNLLGIETGLGRSYHDIYPQLPDYVKTTYVGANLYSSVQDESK